MGQDLFAIICGSLAFVFLFANLITSLKMAKVLSEHGVHVSYPLMHIRVYYYASLYKSLTKKEEGHEGPLYSQFRITNWLAMMFLGLGILSIYVM